MRKILLLVGLIVCGIVVFGDAFTQTIDKIISISDTCVENLIFTEELYNLSTGETWGMATYIPVDSHLQMVAPFINEEGVSGFLVVKFLESSTSTKVVSGSVKLTGKDKYDDISDVNPRIALITDHFYVRVDHWAMDSEFYIATDEDYLTLYISTTQLLNNHDYILTLKTATAVATWKIRKNGLEYQKFLNILKEKPME